MLICVNAFAQTNWVVDSSSVTFEILNAGIAVNGSFDGLNANIKFDPEDLSRSKVIASIEAGTVNTGIRIRDKHLRKPDYFFTDSFPTIQLTCEDFYSGDDGGFTGNWTLALKGHDKPVSIPFTFKQNSSIARIEGSFVINRREFDIGGRSPILADEVTVAIVVWAHHAKQAD